MNKGALLSTPNYLVIGLSCVSLCLSGCAGRAPNPIMMSQPGDYRKSCTSIASELYEVEGEINKRLPKQSRTGQNVALGVAGAFLIVPWFFMNFSEAEKIEIDAFRMRYNNLVRIYNDKNCGAAKQEIPAFSNNKPDKSKKTDSLAK